jgi:MinD superfamily P-loop ATPase
VPMGEVLEVNGCGPRRSGGFETLPGAGGGVVNQFTIKEDVCVGCNMCSLVCPVEGCITMTEVDTGKPPMSWNEYQAKLATGEVAPIRPPGHV